MAAPNTRRHVYSKKKKKKPAGFRLHLKHNNCDFRAKSSCTFPINGIKRGLNGPSGSHFLDCFFHICDINLTDCFDKARRAHALLLSSATSCPYDAIVVLLGPRPT